MTEYIKLDTSLPQFMPFPKFLMALNINDTAKIVYMLLLDRSRLSQVHDGWVDEDGYVFIYYTIENLAKELRRSDMTVKTALQTLEQEDLIRRVRQGVGRPNRIYVRILADKNLSHRETDSFPLDGQHSFHPSDRILSGNKNNTNHNNSFNQESDVLSRKKYGVYENVILTEEGFRYLQKEFPWDYQERIDNLSEYMASTGKVYENHLATIRSWAKREKPAKKKYSIEAYQNVNPEYSL